MAENIQPPFHWKLEVWAKDKVTGKFPAIVLPSVYLDGSEDLSADGKIQKSYTEFKEFCLRNNPNLEFN